MKVVVTGGAGFVGSHLCESLVARGDSVLCIDDFSSGRKENLTWLLDQPEFDLWEGDVAIVCPQVDVPVDAVAHLASPASPADYLARPLDALAVGSYGTETALKLAHSNRARFVLASTSEVYGDALVHPQTEDYWGNVNPIGPRSVYDEAKRFSEALTAAYARALGTNVGIIRIFNTYGPRLRAGDGRVVSNFIVQALTHRPLTIYGDGSQTRSFCYVDDLVTGILTMLDATESGPINLGNPEERTVREIASLVLELTGSPSTVVHGPLPQDDPVRRKPDISKAKRFLGWQPTTKIERGLLRTIEWFHATLS